MEGSAGLHSEVSPLCPRSNFTVCIKKNSWSVLSVWVEFKPIKAHDSVSKEQHVTSGKHPGPSEPPTSPTASFFQGENSRDETHITLGNVFQVSQA